MRFDPNEKARTIFVARRGVTLDFLGARGAQWLQVLHPTARPDSSPPTAFGAPAKSRREGGRDVRPETFFAGWQKPGKKSSPPFPVAANDLDGQIAAIEEGLILADCQIETAAKIAAETRAAALANPQFGDALAVAQAVVARKLRPLTRQSPFRPAFRLARVGRERRRQKRRRSPKSRACSRSRAKKRLSPPATLSAPRRASNWRA